MKHSSLEQTVSTFMHDKIKRDPRSTPGWPEDRVLMQRLAHLAEELGEIATAINKRDLLSLADGLGDMMWIVQGLALDAGIPLPAVLDEIARSNATKQPLDPISGKGGKDTGFSPVCLIEVLMMAGWKGPELPLFFEEAQGKLPL